MRIVHRTQKRLALICAAHLADGAGLQQPPIKAVAVFKAVRSHAGGRSHRARRVVWKGNIERPKLAAEKSRRGERLQLLAFPEIEALADIDERRHRRIARPEGFGDEPAEMRRGHALRRHVARVPVELVPRVQDEAEILRHRRADERAAIHDTRHLLQSLGKAHSIDRCRDARESGQHAIRFHPFFKRRVALRVEGLRVRHAPGHPQHDHTIPPSARSSPPARQTDAAPQPPAHRASRRKRS